MAELTAQDIIMAMPTAFNAASANGLNANVQLRLAGDQGGDWVVGVHNGACTVQPGTVPNPQVTLNADAQDFVGVVTGRLNPMTAFMTGRLRVQGDMGLAARIPSLFKM
jgi:putative sterol carrier protein